MTSPVARRTSQRAPLTDSTVVTRPGRRSADQRVSGLISFALGVNMAGTLGVDDGSAVSWAFLAHALILNAYGGTSTAPLLVRYSEAYNGVGLLLRRGVGSAVAAGKVISRFLFLVGPQAELVEARLVKHRVRGLPRLVENVAIGAARQVRVFLLGASAGMTAVGQTVVAAPLIAAPAGVGRR